MKQTVCRILIAAMLALLILPLGSDTRVRAQAEAAETTAAEPAAASEKEEIIYASLDAAGGVENIYVVNRFQLDQPGWIQDYGAYRSIRNLSGGEQPEVTGDSVRFDLPAGSFYYQGELGVQPLPWLIDISYRLDGEPVSPDAVAGASGALSVEIGIREDERVDPVFFQNYALQVTVTLDGDTCREIAAPDATVASAGSAKTLSYIVLSNHETTLDFSAQVENFGMAGIQFAGISLALDLDEIDSGDFTADLNKLADGIIELDDAVISLRDGVIEVNDAVREFGDGVGELSDGAGELYDGADELSAHAGELADGASQLTDGISDYTGGVGELRHGVAELSDGMSEFSGGVAEYAAQISNYAAQVRLALNSYGTVFTGAADLAGGSAAFIAGLQQAAAEAAAYQDDAAQAQAELSGIIGRLTAAAAGEITLDGEELAQLTADYQSALTALLTASGQLGASQALLDTADEYQALHSGILGLDQGLNSTDAAAPGLAATLAQLADGADQLAAGAGELAGGANDLNDGVSELYDGVGELDDAGDDLSDGAAELSDGIHSYWQDGMLPFKDGVGELHDGVGELKDGADKLYDGVSELTDGVGELSDGTGEMRDETGDMDDRVESEIEGLLADYGGRDFDPVSFVSPQNRVSSVQFVLKTADIEAPEQPQQETVSEQSGGIWQRILALGRYWTQFTDMVRGWFS